MRTIEERARAAALKTALLYVEADIQRAAMTIGAEFADLAANIEITCPRCGEICCTEVLSRHIKPEGAKR